MQLVAAQKPLKKKRNKIHPYKFALWVGCASIFMMFAAFTSAYTVRKAGGNWLEFTLPDVFYYNTFVILLSSIAIHAAYLVYKKEDKPQLYKALLSIAAILGLVFVVLQYQGWQALVAQGIELKTNPSSSFLYVISGIHVAHVIPGIVAILLAFVSAIVRKSTKRTAIGTVRLELIVHYWHFVDLLWIYLFAFLLLQ